MSFASCHFSKASVDVRELELLPVRCEQFVFANDVDYIFKQLVRQRL
jgi:hypothetical protein